MDSNPVKRIICSVGLIVAAGFCHAREAEDTLYIKNYDDKLTARVYSCTDIGSYTHGEDTYTANCPLFFGFGATLYGYTLNLSYGLIKIFPDRGSTKSVDLQTSAYYRKFTVDFTGAIYDGLYRKQSNGIIEIRPDMRMLNCGITATYLFNGNKFSYKAAFMNNERQRKSSGSFMAGAGVYYSHLRADSIYSDVKRFESAVAGPAFGYAHSFIWNGNFFVTVSLGLSFKYAFGSKQENSRFYYGYIPKLAVGYNYENRSLSITFADTHMNLGRTPHGLIGFNSGNIRISYVRRFNSPFKTNPLVKWFPRLKFLW